jgi:polysaccharide biosynthesis PFTS motif protein
MNKTVNDDFNMMNMAGSGKSNAPAADAENCIFFEEITAFFLPLLVWYLLFGRTIHIFKENPRFSPVLKKYHDAGQVVYTDWNEIGFLLRHQLDGRVLDEIERHQDRWIKPSKTIRNICSSLGTEDAEIIFKKALAIQMKSIFQIRLATDELQKNGKHEIPVIFIPGRSFTRFGTPDLFFPPGTIRVPFFAKAIHFARYMVQKCRVISLLLLYPFWILYLTGIPSMKQPEMKSYCAGFRIYNTDLAFFQKERSIDFLVDGITLHRANTVFFLETPVSEDYRKNLALRNYTAVDVPDILGNLEWAIIKKTYPHSIRTWFFILIRSFSEWPLFSFTSLESIHTQVLWSALLERYTLRHHIAYNDTSTVQITRNIMLRNRDITTWYYVHSCGTMNYFSPADCPETPHIIHAYLYFDRFVTWNRKVQDYYTAHPHAMQKFESFGCQWSDSIIAIGKTLSRPEDRWRSVARWVGPGKSVQPGNIIAVYDSTFGGEATLTASHMLAFVHGIARLLEHFPAITVLFKMKYTKKDMDAMHPVEREPEIRAAYNRLLAHPRCLPLTDDNSETSEVIAVSDLVISACFTSPTIETLAALKKGIYFDALGIAKGTFYDRYPNLMAHSTDELLFLADFWLNKLTDNEFKTFIQDYVSGDIDWFADGKAMERFRQAIMLKG